MGFRLLDRVVKFWLPPSFKRGWSNIPLKRGWSFLTTFLLKRGWSNIPLKRGWSILTIRGLTASLIGRLVSELYNRLIWQNVFSPGRSTMQSNSCLAQTTTGVSSTRNIAMRELLCWKRKESSRRWEWSNCWWKLVCIQWSFLNLNIFLTLW